MERSAAGSILLLPEDVVADIFRRLPPHSLAVLRCICGVWRAFIDARRLLRVDLPHTVGGFIINFHGLRSSRLLSHPSAGPAISANLDRAVSGKLDYLQNPSLYVKDHCNGLLLIHDTVVNPATRQSACLPWYRPPCLAPWYYFYTNNYIAFDPAVSPHYQVVSVPRIRYMMEFQAGDRGSDVDPAMETSEWPPSPCPMHVFSSRNGQWEVMSFVRQGDDAVGTIADMRVDSLPRKRHAVYWQDALYVLCETNFLMRFSMSNKNYHVLKQPIGIGRGGCLNLYLGKSENGVYCASAQHLTLRVWFLVESHCQMEWMLKHQHVLSMPMMQPQNHIGRYETPWVLYNVDTYEDDKEDEAMFDDGEMLEHDPDSGVMLDRDVHENRYFTHHATILGFHPYKEVVYFSRACKSGLAYNLNNGKIEEVGSLYPPCYEDDTDEPYVEASYPYTPCLIGKFPETIHLEIECKL